MARYLPWHLPILPPPILSIFCALMPPSPSNDPPHSHPHPTTHSAPPLSSYIPLTPPPASHTIPSPASIRFSKPQTPPIIHISRLLHKLHSPTMEFLELQFEPASFRFYSLPASSAGSSLLTWIAVLAAAAVGFWRIRTVGSRTDGSDASPIFTTPLEETQTKVAPLVQTTTDNEASGSASCSADRPVEMVGTPKVRFTTYFEKENCIGCCPVEEEAEEPAVEDDREESVHREVELLWEREEAEVKWEGMPIRRRGDLGWYSYQDMAALNGSVVRLWDGDSPRRRKASIAISSF